MVQRWSAAAWLRGAGFACAIVLSARTAPAQRLASKHVPNIQNGRILYAAGCAACHGASGKGAPKTSTEFKRPSTFPDFTKCNQTTPETDEEWKAVIVHGGPARGFSTIMPSFSGVLSSDQVDDLMAYLREMCTNSSWPRGELNLPRAMVTEKAFPEDELVLYAHDNATGPPNWTTHAIHEEVVSPRDQIEVDGPWDLQRVNHSMENHIGDMTFGLKHVMLASMRTGTILSLQSGVIPPTGSKKLGGNGTTVFEPYAALDQLFRTNTWIQFQMGADLPRHPNITPQSMFYYTAIGQTWSPDHRLGSQWSPMVELLANRNLQDGAKTDWDVLPELQVTLSPRQHIRADFGVRQPFTDTAGRKTQLEFYILWDWADGKFWEGW
ncbi:MAG: c-type cytochrome [Acidobacteriota bacterium]